MDDCLVFDLFINTLMEIYILVFIQLRTKLSQTALFHQFLCENLIQVNLNNKL